jgi:hypothetical protein
MFYGIYLAVAASNAGEKPDILGGAATKMR